MLRSRMVYSVTKRKSRRSLNVIHALSALTMQLHRPIRRCTAECSRSPNNRWSQLSYRRLYRKLVFGVFESVSLPFIYEFTVDECLIFKELSFCFKMNPSERLNNNATCKNWFEIVRNWFCWSSKVDINEHISWHSFHFVRNNMSLKIHNKS